MLLPRQINMKVSEKQTVCPLFSYSAVEELRDRERRNGMDDEGIKLLCSSNVWFCTYDRWLGKKKRSRCARWHGMATKASTIFSFFFFCMEGENAS